MDGNLTIFSVGIIVQFRHAFQQFFYDNPMRFDMQYKKFDIFRYSQAISYVKSRPEMICTPFTGCPVKGVHIISERLFIILLLIFFCFISPGGRGILHGCDLAFFDAFCALRHK